MPERNIDKRSLALIGPWCGMVLEDIGAEVLMLEHMERGDDT